MCNILSTNYEIDQLSDPINQMVNKMSQPLVNHGYLGSATSNLLSSTAAHERHSV
jgi:hypothetical protein